MFTIEKSSVLKIEGVEVMYNLETWEVEDQPSGITIGRPGTLMSRSLGSPCDPGDEQLRLLLIKG